MRKFKYGLIFLVTMMVACMSLTAFAAGEVNTQKPSTVKVVAQHEETLLKDIEFDLYHLAAMYPDASKVTTDDFSFFQWHFDLNKTSELQKMAETFEAFAVREGIAALNNGKTDNNGTLVFPQNQAELKPGVYLVSGHNHVQDGYIYSADPFIVTVPMLDDAGQWDYNAIAYPKFSKEPIDNVYTNITVVKVWADNGYEISRPAEVTVHLYKNRELYDTVVLNAANNWRWEWTELEKAADWTVSEDSMADYTSVVEKNGNTFVITNTYDKPVPPDQPELPDTGMHWGAPVLLFTGGLLLVLIGLVRRRAGEYEE